MNSKIYMVRLIVEVPVVADSEDEACDVILDDNFGVLYTAAQQAVDDLVDEDTGESLELFEVYLRDLEDEPNLENMIPWGDDSNATIGERLRAEPEEDDYIDEYEDAYAWSEPSHEDD